MAAEKNISIDLGAQSIAMGIFGVGPKDQLILERFASTDLLADPSSDATRLEQTQTALADLSKTLRVAKKPVRYAVSSHSVFTRFAKLPPLDMDQLEQIVGFEAQQQVPFPIEEAVWDYQTLGQAGDVDVEVVLVAIKADDLEQIDSAVRSNGMITQNVDLAPMALYNAFRYNYPEVDRCVVLVDIGARSTNLIYVEGNKIFVRIVNVGGREITQAIAKEFGIPFQEAEERKIREGFVALGGAFADHDDPEIAAMSKVIRQALTRLHSEVVRTNTFYRNNQGGSDPVVAFLCGAGAGLPYLDEFFREKLKIQVEYLNAFRNVRLGKVDEARVRANAHALGELVGLALRGLGNTPVALDLIPRTVQRERTLARRAPFYWLAGVAAAAMLAASGLWYQKAAALADGKVDELKTVVNKLTALDGKIADLESRLEGIRRRSDPYSQAVFDRVYWIDTFNQLGQAMVDDKVWFVELQPLAADKQLLPETGSAKEGELVQMEESAEAGLHTIDKIRLRGLWRSSDDPAGANVVFDYLNRLRTAKRPLFDIAERDETGRVITAENGEVTKKYSDTELVKDLDYGSAGNRYAYGFYLELPLPETRRIQFTK